MRWLLFTVLGPLSWAISTHIDKYLVDRFFHDSDTAVLMVFTGVVAVFGLPVIWFFEPSVLSLPAVEISVMTASGVLYMGAMLFYLRAIQSEEASAVAPFFQLSTIFTLLLAYFFLGEKLAAPQLSGIGLIVAGALAVSADGAGFVRHFKMRLLFLMAGATFIMAVSAVLFKYFAVEEDFWGTIFWTFVGEGLFGAGILLIPSYRQQFMALFKRSPGAMLGINATNELINLGGGLGVRYASLLAPVALVSAVSSTTTLFVFAFGVVLTLFFPAFGREDLSGRNLLRKGLAALLVTAGVMLADGR
ncbi:MAG TPA: EamA family transporter [Micropepsaceae bacterium]|jgi:drug/metabolite transporter (DMT)-like permease|nr:EamA family transporter [Micropepsaceae bacterium]